MHILLSCNDLALSLMTKDALAKVDGGNDKYTLDVVQDENLIGTVRRSPKCGALVLSFGDASYNNAELIASLRLVTPLPILVLCAQQNEKREIACFRAGRANINVVNGPFTAKYSGRRIVAYIEALIRAYKQPQTPEETLRFGTLELNLKSFTFTVEGKYVHLTAREFLLMKQLMTCRDTFCSRERLGMAVWGDDDSWDEINIATHIKRIRSKIESAGVDNPDIIQTKSKIGYRVRRKQS